MKSGPVIILYAVGCIVGAVTQNLPYNPTSILQDPRNKSFAYVFRPASDLSTRQLVSVDASSRLSGSNISFEILTENLPFSTDDSAVFLPSISEHGDISVYTGDCGSPATSTIWRFTNFNASRKGSGTWAQAATHTAPGMSSSSSLPRAYFLGRVFEFSTFVDTNSSQTKLYMFGGMCPNDDVNATTWQTAAQYSNRMMRLSPTSDMNYSIDITTSRSSPVAEAGFSLTKLTPTYSNNSNVKTQQQNFVLIGGHTESAFISMSQIAIWSVPEEAWNFVKVEIPLTTNINSEASEDSSSIMIDSRSGHTAILTEDGSKIIVYGGWVGDTGQAAEPQLAILNLGSGYGGSGNWGWSIPSNQPPGSGRYGHGAMMLPGNVMMVTGGFNIATHTKRALEFGTHTVFFNATSLTWSSNYTNPEYVAKESIHQVPSSLGMRIAVGLGLAAVVGVVLLCVGYKRHRKQKGQRDDNIRGLSEIATNSNLNHGREMRSTGGVFPWSNGGWNQGVDGFDSYASGSHRGPTRYENMSLAVDSSADPVYILPPPSKHILPKSSYTKLRGSYQPANYDTGGLGTSLDSDESDLQVRLARLSVGSAKPAKSILDDLLSSNEGGKNDYDWLLTPPGTPLVPSSEGKESQQPARVTTRSRSTVRSSSISKTSRLSVSQSESNNNNNYPSRPARSSSVTRSSISTTQYTTNYSTRNTNILNTSSASVSSYIRPSTPTRTARPSTPSSTRTTPSRTSTPSRTRPTPTPTPSRPTQPTRPSTPTSRPQTPGNSTTTTTTPTIRPSSRSSTPTRRTLTPSLTPSTSSLTSGPRGVSNGPRSVGSGSRPSSPSPRVRPPPQPMNISDFSHETPPNLRTTLPDRPLSAGRSRPGASLKGNLDNSPNTTGTITRRHSSPSVIRGRVHPEPSGRTRPSSNGHVVESLDPRRTSSHLPQSLTRKPVKPSNSENGSTGFGRNISKKSLDMAIKHMDIRNGGVRPLSGSTLFPQSIRSTNSRAHPPARASSVDGGGSENGSYSNGYSWNRERGSGPGPGPMEDESPHSSYKLSSEVDIYESSRYDAILLKEDLKNTSWLHTADDKNDEGFLFDNGFESLPEPFSPL